MAQVLITKNKLDSLAQTVATKGNVSLPLTIDEMNTIIANLSGLQATLQTKTITPTTSTQTITPDTGYDGFSSITINAIPANYVDTTTLQTYYTGSTAPDSSLGNDGDLYFQEE